ENGLKPPPEVKVEYVMGDPQKPFYQVPAKAVVLGGMYPPLWLPTEPATLAAVRYAAVAPANKAVLEAKLQFEGRSFLLGPTGEKAENEQDWGINFAWARFLREGKLLGQDPRPHGKAMTVASVAGLAAMSGGDP